LTSGKHNEIVVPLLEAGLQISEISIRPEKYRRKNNPAVDLIAEVFSHKDQNRKAGLPFYSFEQYDKLRFDLNGITHAFRNKWYLKPFKFIFSQVDTNRITQKVAFPFYLRERLTKSYYRREPLGQKARLLGERQSGFHDENHEEDGLGLDANGVSAFLNATFTDIDIYEPRFQLFGREFIGPLSGIANAVYRFYIEDTVTIDNKQYADVFFAPINKADLAFTGNMLVALDSTYVVMKVEMGISKDINLNWVSDLHIEQSFERVGAGTNSRLLLIDDAFTADFKILKNAKGRSLLVRKTTHYQQYDLMNPPHDSIFKNNILLERDTGAVTKRPLAWWLQNRHKPLTTTESFVEQMVDSIQQVPIFKFLEATGELLGTGYKRVYFFDIGQIGSFYSYNDLEGNRFRVGGRTNARLYKPLSVGGYAAYGQKDKKWKYQAYATLSFNGKVPRTFPQHQMTMLYQKDLLIPGFALGGFTQDNIALSFQRSASNRMLWTQTHRIEYKREYENQFSFSAIAQRKSMGSAGTLLFEQANEQPINPLYKDALTTTEIGVVLRYAPNQKFYAGANERLPIPGKFPVFTLISKNGIKGFAGGEYVWQKLQIGIEKRFFVAPFGSSNWTLNAGRIWGTVPYPLLEIHAANQSYFNDLYAFNLMNFMEFASDKYVSLNIQHNFNGFIFNKLPLIKKLKLREVVSFKGLYGGLDTRNRPVNNPKLFYFPVDANGNTITQALGNKPYIEASAGISNIFGFIRVDYIRRLNYTEQPGTTRWGIRFTFAPGF